MLALGLVAACASAHADDVTPTATNWLWHPLPPAGGSSNPTIPQFGGFSAVTSSASTSTSTTPPANGNFRLDLSHVGGSFAGAPPEFSIGDTIGLPLVDFRDAQDRPVALRREPVRKTDAPFKYKLFGSSTVLTFTPNTALPTERFFWSPHASYTVVDDAAGAFEQQALTGQAGTLKDGFTYANQAGGARIFWRTLSPIGLDGSNNAIYGLVERPVSVASSSRRPVRRIFWTENGFQGPIVSVPRGDIQQVRVAYTDRIPDLVPEGQQYRVPGSVDSGTPLPRFTLFYDTQQSAMRAYNLEGRMMIELLGEARTGGAGLRRQIGIEVVDIIQEAPPVLVEVPLGERLYPLPPEKAAQQVYPPPINSVQRDEVLRLQAENLAAYTPSLVVNLSASFTGQFDVDGRTAYYAERATNSASDVQIFWMEPGLANLKWPRFLDRYHHYWPDDLGDYAVNVRPTDADQVSGTRPIFGELSNFQLVYQDDPANAQARTIEATQFEVGLNGGDPTNRSLLLFRAQDGTFWYVRVESVLDTYLSNPRYAEFYISSDTLAANGPGVTALVGERLPPPAGAASVAGYVDFKKGDAIDPSAYINPFTAGIPAAELGAIIPVNAAPRGSANKDELGVWWFKKVNPPASAAGKIQPLYWPSYFVKYKIKWPLDAPQIVLAANEGTGDLSADAAAGYIYYQNNPALHGYNPNEEHAIMFPPRAYALRDDLNNPAMTSEDYVLVRYTSNADKRPAMKTFRVLRENETYTFTYDAKAGSALGSPMPLGIMPVPIRSDTKLSANIEVPGSTLDNPGSPLAPDYYSSFTYEDRKGQKWIYRAMHNPGGERKSFGMKFYYNTRAGFAYPDSSGVDRAPPVGTITPFLHDGSNGDVKTGTALTINFKPYWPDLGPSDGPGLNADYYPNTTFAGAATRRLDAAVNFNSATPPVGASGSPFSVRWSGFIIIPANGNYTFYADAVGSAQLWVGQVTGDPSQPTVPLTAGQRVPVRLEYVQSSGTPFTVSLSWEGPGITKTLIPSSALSIIGKVDEVHQLQLGETLVKSKFGLPSLAGASSARILYQQSIGKPAAPIQSAKLHDPTRRKVYNLTSGGLSKIPASANTSTSRGRTYFQNLPAHLQERFFFDPTLGPGNPSLGALVLEGEFKDEVVGEDYLLPNILSIADLAAIQGLVSASDRAVWDPAITQLSTTLETFKEDPNRPGTYIPDTTKNIAFDHDDLVEVTNDEQAVDSYALTAVGGGEGYVTLIMGNGKAFTDQSEPVQMQVIRVGPDLYQGQVKPLNPVNPLSERMTMQHTGDFAGRVQDYEFEWFYTPAASGQPPAATNRPGATVDSWLAISGITEPRVTLGSSQPLLSLTDNYYVMHYRRKQEGATPAGPWSAWTEPALAEGWIKRVLAGINPFNQRLSDFYNNAINTDVSLLTQAGTRWEGDVALTLESVQDAGLIEIYETVLRRGMSFTIEGTPAIDYAPANDALLLAAGYLNDLYMALGNEAYADASNPLISLDVDPMRFLNTQSLPASIGTTIQSTATARYAFEGQMPNLLDEELTLLRGRDDLLVPGTQTAPIYNRFFWNYTRGINAGEVIYALNYNITEKAGANADGKIDATDASRQYPQGHGDAYGHYLTAMTNYYRLLSDQNFTWTPRPEAVNILGVPVTVDYQDERKLAAATVALGRTASRIIDLERRKLPIGTDNGWKAMRDDKTKKNSETPRAWGVEQWACRGAQGNFIHWAVINSLLPENDRDHEGIQKIDRQNVPELDELASLGSEMQAHLDGANRHANALNLSDDSVLFDLSPAQLAAGSTHFDQILTRAKAALANAATAHARTVDQNALLRTVENQASDYNFTVTTQETSFENRLRDIYGQPYSSDIGPGKTYPQGYTGPDFLRFMFIDRPYVYSAQQLFGTTPLTTTFTLPIKQSSYSDMISRFNGTTAYAGNLNRIFTGIMASPEPTVNFTYDFDLNQGPYQIATNAMGRRGSTGKVQDALTRVMNAREQMFYKLDAVSGASAGFQSTLKTFQEDLQAKASIRAANSTFNASKLIADKTIGVLKLISEVASKEAETVEKLAESTAEALPKVVGPLANDVTAPARSALLAAAMIANKSVGIKNNILKIGAFVTETTLAVGELAKNEGVLELEWQITNRANIDKINNDYSAIFKGVTDLDEASKELVAALNNYQNVLVAGLAIQDERETFRKRAASAIQGARTRDVAFRAFRTESLEQYKILFDQAAQYAFLAAKAYDYETAQLGTNSGREFLSGIVATRALGLVGSNGEPQFGGSGSGDPGLSSFLAKLQADWSVAKGRLGINNPDQYGTLFSLRRELFNLPYKEVDSVGRDGSTESHTAWQDKLRSCVVADLRTDAAIAAHALPTANPSGLAQPGFVITFSGDINSGFNFFGNALGAGDSAFSTASYSTKINSVGIAFQGYLGMNPYATGSTGVPGPPSHGSPDALAATPYAYLIPAGTDTQRTPPLNGAAVTERHWLVLDHAMPLPYNIGGSGFGQSTSWTSSTSLSEPFFLPRMHQPFRAVADPTLFYSSIPAEFTNRRLIGRSVWNTKWKLVIPAQTLLANPQDGIERFIRSVKDIKLFLRTYSNAGN